MFSPLADSRFALAVETIYEGYLVHYGRPRLFAPGDPDTVLLLGDYLYAQGLVRLSAAGSVEAVADMGELISLCAKLRAEESGDDGPAWAATIALLGRGRPRRDDRAAGAARTGLGALPDRTPSSARWQLHRRRVG